VCVCKNRTFVQCVVVLVIENFNLHLVQCKYMLVLSNTRLVEMISSMQKQGRFAATSWMDAITQAYEICMAHL